MKLPFEKFYDEMFKEDRVGKIRKFMLEKIDFLLKMVVLMFGVLTTPILKKKFTPFVMISPV